MALRIILSPMGKAVFFALVAALIIKLFLIDFMTAEGSSMEPAIQNGKILVINRMQYGLRFPWQKTYLIRWGIPRPGEVVVFYTPDDGAVVVKRCKVADLKGSFFAQGDNGAQSFDSRSYGAVPADNTIGRVLGVR